MGRRGSLAHRRNSWHLPFTACAVTVVRHTPLSFADPPRSPGNLRPKGRLIPPSAVLNAGNPSAPDFVDYSYEDMLFLCESISVGVVFRTQCCFGRGIASRISDTHIDYKSFTAITRTQCPHKKRIASLIECCVLLSLALI